MSVTVLTCFEVRSRRRRSNDDNTDDRKAFRLCIFDDDCDRLLNESAWPDSVSVSKWFFKPKQQEQREQDVNQQTYKRRKVDSAIKVVAAAAPASQDLSISDDTIVGHYIDCSENAIINVTPSATPSAFCEVDPEMPVVLFTSAQLLMMTAKPFLANVDERRYMSSSVRLSSVCRL